MSFIRPFYVKKFKREEGKMALKKYLIVALVAIMAMVLPVGSPTPVAAQTPQSDWMEYGGYNRTYEYYVPTSYNESEATPLVFSFHGLGSNGEDQADLTKFHELAEEEGFIAVFPDATVLSGYHPILPVLPGSNIQWNLGGPGSLQYYYDVDDLGFIAELVDLFKSTYNIDASRVYATGMSNGAMLSYYVSMLLPGTFAGFAAVCSPMTLNLFEPYIDFDLDVGCPVTMILMQGTDDPIVDYDGMPGVTGSVNETIDYWKDVDNTTTGPVETVWGPTEEDDTIVTRYVYGGGTDGTEVILYKVEGGGHTWPGGEQYADPLIIGYVTTHIDGTAHIWDLLKEHSLPPLPPVRQSPKEVTAGEEFEVTINFAAPADNFTDITLTDTAPAGWTVSVDTDWTTPTATDAQTPASNKAEYTWDGPYDEGTAFTAVYKVTVPGGASPGTYTFTGSLDYSIDGAPDEVTVAGNTRVKVLEEYTLTITSTTGGSVTMPSGTGPFTYREGKVVYLTATPDTDYKFDKWSGDVGTLEIVGTNDRYAIVTMNDTYEITAEFVEKDTEEPEPPSGGCFIATAAYGTSTAEQLDVLREFRDDVLLKSTVGSQLVDLYYQMSPPVADFISDNSFVRTLVRELLIDPIVWVVEATGGIWRN
jgi:polyhydroxybutyrate depolymerase